MGFLRLFSHTLPLSPQISITSLTECSNDLASIPDSTSLTRACMESIEEVIRPIFGYKGFIHSDSSNLGFDIEYTTPVGCLPSIFGSKVKEYLILSFSCDTKIKSSCVPVVGITAIDMKTRKKQKGIGNILTSYLETILNRISSNNNRRIVVSAVSYRSKDDYKIGAYVWAKAGFEFKNRDTTNHIKQEFEKYLNFNRIDRVNVPYYQKWKPVDYATNEIGRRFLLHQDVISDHMLIWDGLLYPARKNVKIISI